MNTTDAKEVPVQLVDKQLVRVTGYTREWFTAGSLEAFHAESVAAAKRWNWEMPPSIEEEIENAKKKGECIAWLNLNSTALVGDPGYYERQRKIEAAAPVVALHGLVEIEKRVYRVEPAWNHNVKLVPQ